MIFVPGTDVHWGDPVNTSSKLGQDIAQNGEILITTPVFKSIERTPQFKNAQFKSRKFQKSHVEFICYAVHLPTETGSTQRPQHTALKERQFKSFSVGIQCEMPGQNSGGRSTRPKGNVFGLPSGASQIQRYPRQLDQPRDNRGTIGKSLIHNMMNRSKEQAFSINPSRSMGAVSRPVQLTETTQQRRRADYERTTKGGFNNIGEQGDAMVLYPGSQGGHPVLQHHAGNRGGAANENRGIGAQILNLGELGLPLKTTKLVMTQSNYNPVLGHYPARPPYAGNSVNPRASPGFMAEAKRRTAPETLTGARPMKTIRNPNAKKGESVGDNLTKYGHLGLAEIKNRGTLAIEQSSGRGVVDTFKQMEIWSEDNYMPNPPITRFDGSGRGVSPRKRETFNRILQMEHCPNAEENLKKKEQSDRDAIVQRRLATGYSRQASYNIVSIRDRNTGKLCDEAEIVNRGVKNVVGGTKGSGAVGSLLGASAQRRATIDPTNHPKFHFQGGNEEVLHQRGGVHQSEEAYLDQGRQITGANQLAKLIRYEEDGALIRSHQREDQFGRTGEES